MKRFSKKPILLSLISLTLLGFFQQLLAQTSSIPDSQIEPKALTLLKAMSERLAAARSMTFTAVTTYESPSRLGPPLIYKTVSEVTLQRPGQLRVITPGDGKATEFYYNGKTLTAYSPTENLVAITDAPANLDAALKLAYDVGDIYFPFSDVIVSNPYQDIAEGLKTAFVMGQSQIVGGTTTDIVVVANDQVFAQIWIGTDDKLPRMIRAIYRDDLSRLRHQVEFEQWKLDVPISADAFTSSKAQQALPIPFARPEPISTPNSTQKAQ